jgi:hypothetical protein
MWLLMMHHVQRMNKSRKHQIYWNALIWRISLYANLLTQVISYEVIIDDTTFYLSFQLLYLSLLLEYIESVCIEAHLEAHV